MDENLQYEVDCNYETEYSCYESGCNKEGICRCGRITDVRIGRVRSWELAQKFATLDIIQNHAIERVVSRLRTDDFDIEVQGSYYGDEIDSITLTGSARERITKIQDMYTSAEWIEYYLALENGKVMPQRQGRSWEHVTVPTCDVMRGRNRASLDEKLVQFYTSGIRSGYQPILLCEKVAKDKFKLIDGYHRFEAATDLDRREIDVIYFRDSKRKLAEFELGGAL